VSRLAAAALLLLVAGRAGADETVTICFNYGCASEAEVRYAEDQLQWIRSILLHAGSAEREREVLALAVGQMYAWAGQQSPVWRDRGGNRNDGEASGRMDCIDHSTTTTRFLRLIERRGWLRFHRVLPVARRVRFLFAQHFSAQIEVAPWRPWQNVAGRRPALALCGDCDDDDADGSDDDDAAGQGKAPAAPQRFVVDSWFVDNGRPAVVMPLEEWLQGGGPDV
jgi:hypothetical protein